MFVSVPALVSEDFLLFTIYCVVPLAHAIFTTPHRIRQLAPINGELYNAASSTRGLQCQMLLPASSTDAAPSAPAAHAPAPSTSSQLHWAYGPDIYRHLRAVRTPGDLAIFRREMKL